MSLKPTIVLVAIMCASCTSTAYRASVASFASATAEVTSTQIEDLNAAQAAEAQNIRQSLIDQRAILRLSEGCGFLTSTDVLDATCGLVTEDGVAVEKAAQYKNIIGLNKAIGSYVANLALLAENTDGEGLAYRTAITNLATAFGGLSETVQQQAEEQSTIDRRTAVANLLGGLGDTYFASARTRQLRTIIARTDPMFQQSLVQLGRANEALGVYNVATQFETTFDAQVSYNDAIVANANSVVLKTKQNAFFDAHAVLKKAAIRRDTFKRIAESHAALAQPSSRSADSEDINETIARITELVSLVRAAQDALKEEKQ